jgi:valyl-tRNA synthetase
MTEEMAKRYEPAEFEERIYAEWESSGKFTAKTDAARKPYTIVIPPPNVTGVLHMGHGLNNTIQDMLIRYHRMRGENVLWLPGTDHAGIATQNVVEKKLAKEGKKRGDIGRERFISEVWKWKEEHGSTIVKQLRKIGSACDWSRERFTMDEGLSRAVREVFVRLHEKGLIYRGEYIINWCPRCGTALADEEAEHKEVAGTFTYIRYPFVRQEEGMPDGLVVATTRPETMLGDAAVAVHPEDERFKHLIGRELILPLTGRAIPVIADTMVDREFGTGAVKITPAHDPNDFESGRRHNLPRINVMHEDGTINENAPEKYRGMDRFACRKAVLADLEAGGYFVKQEKITHQVGHCYRCGTIVEPYLSRQWFVRMAPLAEPATRAVENGEITFYTERWKKVYLNWMYGIRDWCISRQIWWGHQIPAWYAVSESGGRITPDTPFVVARSAEEAQLAAAERFGEGVVLQQDADVLDTWFSSWLWPFSTLGWPEKTPDLAYFYPTSVLVTDMGIIFFWVARMIMAGYFCMGELPFRHVYINSTVMDAQGRKMSKSLDNGIDPLDVIRDYGADALRFTILAITPPGQNTLLSTEKFQLGSRFANKIWNASRYILASIEGDADACPPSADANMKGGCRCPPSADANMKGGCACPSLPLREKQSFEDRWILSRLQQAITNLQNDMAEYRLNDAANGLAHFFRDDFCDWYIEFTKQRLYGENEEEKQTARGVLRYVLEASLRLLHPVMPFITEEIYQRLYTDKRSIMDAAYPEFDSALVDEDAEARMRVVQEIVSGVRNVRAEMRIPPEKALGICVATDDTLVRSLAQAMEKNISTQAKLNGLRLLPAGSARPKYAASIVGQTWEVWVPLEGLIDIDAERARLTKEKERLLQELKRVRAKLANTGFTANAPEEVVALERDKLASWESRLARLDAGLQDLAE